ncbi:MAG TPA: hypothetical protein PKA00_21960 [Saprospiraceae bacterium]|nr:hypothetical protein [Saprospiraceae bacterium]HMQ85593.1 hypothetical protein [Saprospiraceae bacterium]
MYAPFVISGILWHEIGEKVAFVNTNKLEDALEDNLSLSDYGTGITAIAFIYIVVQPTNIIHEEEMRYRRKKKEVYIQKKMPIELVEQYERPQVLQLMAATYLSTVRDLRQLKIPDFDHARFEHAVESLFRQEGWLVAEGAV